MENKEQTFLKNTELQFRTIEKALLKAKKEGKKTINLKDVLSEKPEREFNNIQEDKI